MRVKTLLAVLCFSAVILLGAQFLTSMGDRVIAFNATVSITPKTFNVNMQGQWITVRIKLPEDYNINDIDVSTIRLEGLFQVEWSNFEGKALMVKFDASNVADYLLAKLYHMGLSQSSVDLTVEGKLNDGTLFSGSDTITIMNP
jgi:hypothetical protein